MEYKDNLTAEYVRSILDYNPETGIFIWRDRAELTPCNRARIVGKIAGCISNTGYIQIKINNIPYQAHRLAWLIVFGKWPNKELDHINTNRIDNRIVNLREADDGNQAFNQTKRKTNTSGYKGVTWSKKLNKWHAQISINYKKKHLGHYDNILDAAKAYENAAKELHGKFARY